MAKRKVKAPYQDASVPVETRVRDLVARMTLEEKIAQMGMANSLNVARNGKFSQALAAKTLKRGVGAMQDVRIGEAVAILEHLRQILHHAPVLHFFETHDVAAGHRQHFGPHARVNF